MRLFLCLSALATATAQWKASYTTAKQAYEALTAEWFKGDISNFESYFSDDAFAEIPPSFVGKDVSPEAYPHMGKVKIKDVGFDKYFGQFLNNGLEPPSDIKMAYFEKDARNIIVDVSMKAVGFDGINRAYGFFIRYRTNADNKGEYIGWTMYDVEKLDAASVGNKFYAAWKAGDIATVSGTFVQDIKMISSGDRLHGNVRFNGFADWTKWLTEHPNEYTDDNSQFKYSVSANSADGTTASADLETVRTYKSGAKFHSKFYQSWVVNSNGKVTEIWTTVQSETPMNARATWEDTIAAHGRGDMDGAFATYGPNFKIAYGGATKNLEYWPTLGWKRGEVLDRDAFIAILPKQMPHFKNLKMDFKYISETDNTMIVRYDMTYHYKEKNVHFLADYTFDFDENFKFQNCFGNFLEIGVSDLKDL